MLSLALVFVPIGFGIYGLISGRLPVSSKRSLHGEYAKTYSIGFIGFPIFLVATAIGMRFLVPIWFNDEAGAIAAFYPMAIGLPLVLVVLVTRAQKLARRLMFARPKQKSQTVEGESDQMSIPDDENLNPYDPPRQSSIY